MARAVNRLTEAKVKSKKLAKGLYHDGGGLYLQVGPNGSKSWIYRYKRKRAGEARSKARDMGLGPYPAVSLAEARDERDRACKLHKGGKDPLEEKVALEAQKQLDAVRGQTFQQAAETYIATHEDSWRNPKHRQQWRNTLATYAYPLIGHLAIAEITVIDVRAVIEPIWRSRPETASRVRGRIETVINAARADDDGAWSNPARWERHKSKLPARPKQRHHPALSWKKVPAFMRQLRAMDGISARALEFTILTAARTNETLGATFKEFDLEDRRWKIPGARMKGKQSFVVPLSRRAVEIVRELDALRVSEFLFPGLAADAPLSDMAMLELLRSFGLVDDEGDAITVHGFRSSFRDWAGEKGYPHDICETALAHARKDKTHAAYQRGPLLELRRQLMTAWAQYCQPVARSPKAGGKRVSRPSRKVASRAKTWRLLSRSVRASVLLG